MGQRETNRDSYNQIVAEWSAFRNRCPVNSCVRELCERLPIKSRVLDVGCGTGHPIDVYLNDNGFSVVGIDISENMIHEAQKLHLSHAAFEVADYLEFHSAEKFDAIIAFDSIWHIEEARQEQIYRKASSLLNNNGYFLFTHGKKRGTVRGNMYAHEFVYSSLDQDEVKRLLLENGFRIIMWAEDYQEKTTGSRDLLVVAQKHTF